MHDIPSRHGEVVLHVLHVLQTQDTLCAYAPQATPMTGPGAGHVGQSARGARELFPLECVLVLLLYVSLLSDIVNIIRGRYHSRTENPVHESRTFRPFVSSIRKSCDVCQEKKSIRSLDTLWRRMRQATYQMRLINLRHHMITKAMMESRMEARLHEKEKLQKKKEKLFGDILQSIRPSLVLSTNRFTDTHKPDR